MNQSTTLEMMRKNRALLWDVFCHVIDNYGDIGVCWRLASDLARRGHTVRLWIDDTDPLRWMAPHTPQGVRVLRWRTNTEWPAPADIVIESFACTLPEAYVSRMVEHSRSAPPPVWINLEHLSAEAFVERNHQLPSPQLTGTGLGLNKWFFYPGFTQKTGGLLREQNLTQQQVDFDAVGWRASHHLSAQPEERTVSLFCYEQAPVRALIEALASEPTVLLTTHGIATQCAKATLGPTMRLGALRAVAVPPLSQIDFDRLLWSSDLNCVRGEDSWVRAVWAAKPFLWQAYPQADGAHERKVEAFLALFTHDAASPVAQPLKACMGHWNGLNKIPLVLPNQTAWKKHCAHWRDTLMQQADLTTQLLEFVHQVYEQA